MTTAFIGQPVSRVDGRQKVTGAATYAAEFNVPGQAHGAIVRSTVANGRIASIDSVAAEQASGVIAVLTHDNAPRLAYRAHKGAVDPGIGERLHVLQDDRVSHQGQPIALVIADNLEQAIHAAMLVRVTYVSEPGTTDISLVEPVLPTQEKTDQGEGPPPETRRGDPDGALAAAEMSIDQNYVIARENHNPLEMHATIAAWDGDRLTLWDKTQWVNNVADEIAAVFGIPAENIRVVSPFVGGAFGSGLRTWPHVTLAALGARVAGRPVKLMLSRREMYYSVGYRPHTVQRVALGASRDGRLAAIMHEGYQETSTYEEFSEALLNASRFLHSCPNVYTRHRIAPMNVHTPTYMRAPGEASGVFALESAMDELAVALNIDPVELRLRNEPEQDEFKKLPFSSRSTRECYRAAAERFGWSRRTPEPGSMRDGRWLIGWGMASATYPMNYAPASATARLLPDGTAEVMSAASDMGPGTWTSMTQVAAETLGLPIERVKFILGDTRLPRAPVHGGSMTMASVGSAVQAACRRAREEALARSGVNELGEAMRRFGQPIEASADVKPGDEAQRFSMHAFGAVFVEVAVDRDLGETRVRRIVGAYGAGRIVNPKMTRSQCIGGMIGGIGMALMEHSVVDARSGRVPNANLAEYAVPVHADAPPVMDVIFVEEHDPHVNPLGVKGVGEIAMVGVAPAIANAVFHATGKRIRELPVTPDKLL
ncbi:xanthine dehydrogenase family protein molybdopterin-binding subunit [Microvirga brassicacearum]|uniref:Xanthine dehydrogenase family protein molybdopterin-binding subunit n=1 Tax=Microvirga brassicacearum TaxID=2580413 RepID=A0A5N3P7H4_9HYPH|nr:xanthine dehydrogenase family protein molybdopterin-binding subunit [Microvirga brassicacearum]KAB0265694.1 xanthine dehydrogenase family protein molybdopterin-binding subunit [Microvirga brassicacearum]